MAIGNDNPLKELKWFFIIFVVLGILWFLSGGLLRQQKEDPLITPTGETYGRELLEEDKPEFSWKTFFFPWSSNLKPASSTKVNSLSVNTLTVPTMSAGNLSPGSLSVPIGSGGGTTGTRYDPADQRINEIYDKTLAEIPKSDLYKKIKINFVAASGKIPGEDPSYESLGLYSDYKNTMRINLTGMTLKSPVTLSEVKIDQAVKVYYPGRQNYKENIFLNPDDYAYVYSGKSPILMSFQGNRCLAYVIPGVPSSCPTPLNYPLPTGGDALNDQCLDYMRKLRACYNYSYEQLPTTLTHECRVFIDEKTGYYECLNAVGSKTGFLSNTYYIYLDRDFSLWKRDREVVMLLDQQGKLVDIVKK